MSISSGLHAMMVFKTFSSDMSIGFGLRAMMVFRTFSPGDMLVCAAV